MQWKADAGLQGVFRARLFALRQGALQWRLKKKQGLAQNFFYLEVLL
jgi:hypothetical protein